MAFWHQGPLVPWGTTLDNAKLFLDGKLRQKGEKIPSLCQDSNIGVVTRSPLKQAVVPNDIESTSPLFTSPYLLSCPSDFQAIKFLLEKDLLNNTPEDVALYLFQNGMDKMALGDYLGEG